MIDLPDHGYSSFDFKPNNPGGTVSGELGGPDSPLLRPGYRWAISFNLGMLGMDDARKFQAMLEQAQTSGDDVSYPWPLDFKPAPAGVPKVNGASLAGAVITIKGLIPGYSFRLGQPVAVISAGVGYVHKASAPTVADGSGNVTLPVNPWTREDFANNDVVEIEKPRIRGILLWNGASQGSFSRRPFSFTVAERL